MIWLWRAVEHDRRPYGWVCEALSVAEACPLLSAGDLDAVLVELHSDDGGDGEVVLELLQARPTPVATVVLGAGGRSAGANALGLDGTRYIEKPDGFETVFEVLEEEVDLNRHASVADPNQRNYYYYASGQLRSISMSRPGTTQGTYQTHELTILYDHVGRPVYVADKNVATGKERRENLYWRADDALLERVVTPDHTAPTTYDVDIFAGVDQSATAWMKLKYVSGSFSSETRYYVARDQVGLVPAVYSFTGVGSSTTAYTADYLPFGEVRASTGTASPALGFEGQLTLVGTDVLKWNGAQTTVLRSALSLGRARAYDGRVGQYVASSARVSRAAASASLSHPYAFARSAPTLDLTPPQVWGRNYDAAAWFLELGPRTPVTFEDFVMCTNACVRLVCVPPLGSPEAARCIEEEVRNRCAGACSGGCQPSLLCASCMEQQRGEVELRWGARDREAGFGLADYPDACEPISCVEMCDSGCRRRVLDWLPQVDPAPPCFFPPCFI